MRAVPSTQNSNQFAILMKTLRNAILYSAASAVFTPSVVAQVTLDIGESRTFQVQAAMMNCFSGIIVEAGAHYEFQVARNDTWWDAKIQCGADGWTAMDTRAIARPLIRAVEPKRRCPNANWMELVGSICPDGCEQFRIGCRGRGWTYTPRHTGHLYAYANDLVSRYHNNGGCIKVTITRMQQPGCCQLAGCKR